jgi:anti-sigma regulatory factor (Ser/Thr protein kinase)
VLDGSVTEQLELALPRDGEAPGLARRALVRAFAGALERDQLDTAKLLTTELVTNAVLHGRGAIVMRAELTDACVRVDVIDEGGGFERAIRTRNFDDLGGWGLSIVDAEASRWGVHEGTTHVWFELKLRGPRLGPA